MPRGDRAVDGRLLRIAFEAFAPATAEAGNRLGGRGNLARREERHGGKTCRGTLVGGIELPYRLDQVVEQVKAIRLRRPGGVKVDDRPAYRELAGAQDLCDLRVAGIREPVAQPWKVDALAGR